MICLYRFFKKTPEELHHQANVSAPLSRPTVSVLESSMKPPANDFDKASVLSKRSKTEELTASLIQSSALRTLNDSNISTNISQAISEKSVLSVTSENDGSVSPSISLSSKTEKSENVDMEMDYEDSSEAITQTSSLQSTATLTPPETGGEAGPSAEPEETIIFVSRASQKKRFNVIIFI